MKVLVIGGVAAGTKAAAKLKRLNRSAEITIVTKGEESLAKDLPTRCREQGLKM